jgi:N-acetylmuramoyl-L-alanine amidase
MPLALYVVALFALLFGPMAVKATAREASPWGREYVDLARWGHQHQFEAHLNAPSGELTLSNRWARLFFKADSKRAEIDGGLISLSFPVRIRNGALHISQLDLEKNIRPILQPPRLAPSRKIQVVAIGAGHGGKDPGKQVGKRQEKDYNLKLAQELEQLLITAGFKVVMIRRSDEFIDLLERPAIAKRKGADVYISLHYNSFSGAGSETAKGVETYCLTPAGANSTNDPDGQGGMPKMPANRFDSENLFLAWEIQRSINSQTELDDRGIRRARFLELTQMGMPAVLIEGGFMTHPEDASLMTNPEGRTQLAEAIRDGLLSYKRTVEREKP